MIKPDLGVIWQLQLRWKHLAMGFQSIICHPKYGKHNMKPGVNFTKALWVDFAQAEPKSTKRHRWLDCLFALLGYACVKTVCKTLVKERERAIGVCLWKINV